MAQTKRYRTEIVKFQIFCGALLLSSLPLSAQTPICSTGSLAPTIHAEGLAEQIGDIGVTCTGGVGTVTTSIIVTLSNNITNRLDINGNPTGIVIGGGGSTTDTPILTYPNTMLINTVLVPGSGSFTISGIRVAVPPAAGSSPSNVTATVVANRLDMISQAIVVGVPQPTLLASVLNYGVPCTGSPSPSTTDFPGLIAAGTNFSAVRVREANTTAFAPKSGNADSGIRFLVNLTGYGSNAQVYVPDVIVGDVSPTPTSAGAFSTTVSGGNFTPNTNQLLLTRVVNADSNGAGGFLFLAAPPAVTQAFASASQLQMVNGSGTVTYEVLAATPNLIDSAQIPVFVAAPAGNCAAPLANTLSVELAPVSNVATPTLTDPLPRFLATIPGSDCSAAGDCSAGYFPTLQVAPAAVSLNASSLGSAQTGFVTITAGGPTAAQLTFTISAAYQNSLGLSAANWLSINGAIVSGSSTILTGLVDPVGGIGSYVINVGASPAHLLVPGTYNATVTITAGSYGTVTVPVTFIVGPAGPVIQSVVNAANGQSGPVTAASFASIYGLNLVAKNSLTVTFNGFPATYSYDGQPGGTSTSQINVLVPPGLGTSANAGIVVTVDGNPSNTFPVALLPNAPAVFNPGVLNQNNTVNSPATPASRGDIIQIFLTGLATPITLPLSVSIGDQTLSGSQILWSDIVRNVDGTPYTGLEQVNVQIPKSLDLNGTSTALSICIPGSAGTLVCSAPVNLYISQ